MNLNVNVGYGPVKKNRCLNERKKLTAFTEFEVSSSNDSNINTLPLYNLPTEKQVEKMLKIKSLGTSYISQLNAAPSASQEQKKKQDNRGIPLQFRNKRKIDSSLTQAAPAAKKQKIDETTVVSGDTDLVLVDFPFSLFLLLNLV